MQAVQHVRRAEFARFCLTNGQGTGLNVKTELEGSLVLGFAGNSVNTKTKLTVCLLCPPTPLGPK